MDTFSASSSSHSLVSSCDEEYDDSRSEEGVEDCNSNIPSFSLSKGITAPKKCSYCQKIMFFKTYRCKHCRYRCHKKCAGHTSRRGSTGKQYAGEEHWTKVLQANEVNSNVVALPCSGKHALRHVCCDGEAGPLRCTKDARRSPRSPKDSNIFAALYSRFCDWVNNARHGGDGFDQPLRRKSNSGRGGEGRRLSRSKRNSHTGLKAHHSLPTSGDSYSQEQQMLDIQRQLQQLQDGEVPSLFLPQSPDELRHCYHASVSSEEGSELSSFYLASYSSTCSNLTLTSTSTQASDCPPSMRGGGGRNTQVPDSWLLSSSGTTDPLYQRTLTEPWQVYTNDGSCTSPLPTFQGAYSFQDAPPSPATPTRDLPSEDIAQSSSTTRWRATGLTSRRSKFARTKLASVSVWREPEPPIEKARAARCATWPPTARRRLFNFGIGDELEDDDDLPHESSLDEPPESHKSEKNNIRESLGEFNIPYNDLKFCRCIRKGRRHDMFRGRWHGDVMIHTYRDLTETEVAEFWVEVSRQSKIRHENVNLFMGACLDPPRLAVITSDLKGASLYEQLHLKSERLSMHSRVHIVRQVAQGMGYLHAKGIVLRKLNSKNIYLELKVKICLLDSGMSERRLDKAGYGCIPRGNLSYVAPEMMRSLQVLPPEIVPTVPFTKATDIYAFGTVLYELFSGQFPFSRTCPEILVWQVGRGKRQSTRALKCNTTLRRLVEKCWSKNPDSRPTFADINRDLIHNAALHKRHSSSEPEKLNRLGFGGRTRMFP